MTYQRSLFELLERPPVEPRQPAYDFEPEAEAYRQLGGPFADNQLGIVTLDFGDGLTRRFRFIYNPNNYSVQRWLGPRIEIFGVFGYQNLGNEMRPVEGENFDEWLLATIEAVKDRTVIRFAGHDYGVFLQSGERLGITAKKLSKIANSGQAAREAVREQDKTPVAIISIDYERTDYRSHYEIQDRDIYFGRFPATESETRNGEKRR